MSSISLDNFVKINIVENQISTVLSTRDVVVLFTTSAGRSISQTSGDPVVIATGTYTSLADMFGKSPTEATRNSPLYKYTKIYFNNGGVKLKLKDLASSVLAKADLDGLDRNEIVVAVLSSSDNYSSLSTISDALDYEGGNQKILVSRSSSVVEDGKKNIAVKVSAVVGAEMAIAAYLSKINVYKVNSVHDYAYTVETSDLENQALTNSDIEDVITYHNNVDINLANSVRNIGGDLVEGLDLVNHYVLIILHQTLQDRLVNLLSSKIKGSTGIASMYSTIASELNNYVMDGYLTTDKIWDKETLSVVKEGQNYTIIEEGTPISKGYYTKILPLSSLSLQDKQAHRAPYIYVILATTYGIRVIEVNGEAIL